MGDAAGIGPEIILKSLSEKEILQDCRPVVIGDAGVLRRTARDLGLEAAWDTIKAGSEIPLAADKVLVYDLANLEEDVPYGEESASSGKASAEYIEEAVRLWRAGQIEAVATAPISKRAIHLGGYDYPGHTEFLAYLTETENFAMSFFAGRLRVVRLPLRHRRGPNPAGG